MNMPFRATNRQNAMTPNEKRSADHNVEKKANGRADNCGYLRTVTWTEKEATNR